MQEQTPNNTPQNPANTPSEAPTQAANQTPSTALSDLPARSLIVAPPRDLTRVEEPASAQRLDKADIDFVAEEVAGLAIERKTWVGWTIIAFAATLTAGILWAAFTDIEEITQGTARIVPVSREQVIQSLEGGILKELLVREGAVVEKGQVIVRLDPTKAESSRKEGANRELALKAQAIRLRAEANGKGLVFPKDIAQDKEIVKIEKENYAARVNAVNEAVIGLERSLKLLNDELAITEPMSQKGLIAETELIRLRRQASEIRLQIAERRNKFRADAATELSKVEAELSQVEANVEGRKDILDRTEIRAPLRGTVKNIQVTTVGGVVQPGSDILQIIPLEDQLLVEARIKPADVAFVKVGLPAVVKISAYEYNIYGGLDGVVEYISPDTLRDERRAGQTLAGSANAQEEAQAYYRVTVRTKKAQLVSRQGEVLPIIPGMTATAEIVTGKKSVLDYLLKPVLKVREAFRER